MGGEDVRLVSPRHISKTESARLRELAVRGGRVWVALMFGPCADDYIAWGGKRKAMRLLEACWREVEFDTRAPWDRFECTRLALANARLPGAHPVSVKWARTCPEPPPIDVTPVLSHSDGCWGCRTFGRTERS